MVCAKIGGNLTREEINFEIERAKLFFSGTRNLPFTANTKSVPWEIEVVSPDRDGVNDNLHSEYPSQRIVVQRRLKGKVSDFLTAEETEKVKYHYSTFDFDNSSLAVPLIYLFPYHKVGVILGDSPYRDSPVDDTKSLRHLGYVPNIHHQDEDSVHFGYDTCYFTEEGDLLKILRDPTKEIPAFDQRGRFILETLMKNLKWKDYSPAKFGQFDFGVYQVERKKEEYESAEIIDRLKLRFRADAKVIQSKVEKQSKKMNWDEAIGLYSKFNPDRRNPCILKYHIPMIDFFEGIVPEHEKGRSRIEEVLKVSTFGEGMVVTTGSSAHFYGFNTTTEPHWQKEMQDLFRCDSVDSKCLDINLQRGESMLRITPTFYKPFQPTVYGIFDPSIGKIVPMRTPRL